jgi:hypothetical protein
MPSVEIDGVTSFGVDAARLDFRAADERFDEELYRSIPSLVSVSQSILTICNGLSHDARHAIFYGGTTMDPELRTLKVERALEYKATATFAPDLEWLAAGNKIETPAVHETKDLDGGQEWLAPAAP